MNELAKAFEQWLLEEGRSPKTIESYVGDVKGFQKYLAGKAVDEQQPLSRFSFVRYKQHLLDNEFAISTINKKVNSLKVYNDFLQLKDWTDDNYIQLKKDKVQVATGSEQEVSILHDEQVEQFLFQLEKESQRNQLIGYLLLYTGIRVSELVNSQLVDVDQLNATLKVRGKGGKLREVPLRQDVIEKFQLYLKGERGSSKFPESPSLLVSQRASNLHRDSVRRWLEQMGRQLGFHIHPHMLRHTFCTRLLRNGVELTVVAKLAGHSSVNTTMKHYINVSRTEKHNAVEKL